MLFGQRTRGHAAGLDALEFVTLAHATEDVEQYMPQGDAHGHFDDTMTLHWPLDRHELGALAFLGADGCKPFAAVDDDVGNAGERFGVVRHGRTSPHAFLDRTRRFGSRLSLDTHDGIHQRGRFATDVGATTGADAHCDILAGAEDVMTDQADSLGVGNGLAKSPDGKRIFTTDVVVSAFRATGDARDEDAFENAMRVGLVELPVLVDVRFTFVRIADDELRTRLGFPTAGPLDASGETSATTTAHIRGRDLFDHLIFGKLEKRLEVPIICTPSDCVLDRIRFDHTGVAGDDRLLVAEERIVIE